MYYLSFGDWGETGLLKQRVADIIKQKKPDAILSLGDNFYEYGIEEHDISRWEREFVAYYPDVSFYAILGNHDYLGNVYAQIKYSTLNPNWIMPHRYYNRMYKDVHLIALDTFELATTESLRNSLAMGMKPDTFIEKINQLKREKQLVWLEEVLKRNTSTYIIVFGHYPIFSNGTHGDTVELCSILLPLLKKYKVNLYLSGHDHNICHKEVDGLHCIVSGCGSRMSRVSNRTGFTPLSTSQGIAYVNITEKLEFGFYDLNGEVIFNKFL